MSTRCVSLQLLILILSLSVIPAYASEPPNSKVAILIRSSAWENLRAEISDYMAQAKSRDKVDFEVVHDDFQSPQQVRRMLKSLWQEKGIEGAILIGSIPMHKFYMHDHANPNPLYFEDFTLEYRDENGDGAEESYSGTPDLKIWIASIRSTEQADDDDLDGLQRYFRKLKQFNAGELKYEKRSIIVTDAELGLRSDEAKLGRTLFGSSGVDLLATPKNTLTGFRAAFQSKSYAICTMGVHSDWAGQELEGGELTAREINQMKTGAILVLNHGCSTGNWCVSEKEGTGLSTAQSWIFGSGPGISTVANVRSGCIYGYPQLCESLRAGNSIGQAYLAAKRAGEAEMHSEYPDGSIVSGVLLLGDPLLRFPTKQVKK